MSTPKTSTQQGKESLKRMVIGFQSDTQEQITSIKKEMNEEIEKRIADRYGQTIGTVEAIRDFAVMAIKLMKKKGLLDRKEIDEILNTIKEKGIGELLR